MSRKQLLFVVWDGPYVNYLEGLFLPILAGISRRYVVHIVQFSWNDEDRRERLQTLCSANGIVFTHRKVLTQPLSTIGKIASLWSGAFYLHQYIRSKRIDIVMPRSTMPARMALMARRFNENFKIVFDADGLPIEERIDFAGLRRGSLRYRLLKKSEENILRAANKVTVRTNAAIDVLMAQHEGIERSKFHVVSNGRDVRLFKPLSTEEKRNVRKKFQIPEDSFLMMYVGSMGPQYGLEEMCYIQDVMHRKDPNCYLCMIVNNPNFLENRKHSLPTNTLVRTLPFDQIATALSCADVGLAIRLPTFSMKGVAPIKLGEYLLSGLPVVASSGIGDTERFLKGKDGVFILSDHTPSSLDAVCKWLQNDIHNKSVKNVRALGEEYFSLETAIKSYLEALSGL